jgi:hypothetical protein
MSARSSDQRIELKSESEAGESGHQDLSYVAVAPPKTLVGDLLKSVASLLGKEISDTRLLLAGAIPRIVAATPDSASAGSTAQGLRDAGLVAFVCRDSELRNRPAGFVAHSARPGEGGVTFRDRPGREVRIEAGDVFLIIRARMRSVTREETSRKKMKLNVAATVLTGGIPVMRRVAKKSVKESFLAEDRVMIFDRKSSDPRVEMLQSHVDYGFLGPELTGSTAANFGILQAKLREWFPLAIFDERLAGRFKSDVPAAGPEEALEISSRLIYLCHLAAERQSR